LLFGLVEHGTVRGIELGEHAFNCLPSLIGSLAVAGWHVAQRTRPGEVAPELVFAPPVDGRLLK
jgi:hypothetical protein